MNCCYGRGSLERKDSLKLKLSKNIAIDKGKALFVGSSSVGKTCIIRRMVGEEFFTKHIATIGMDYLMAKLKITQEVIFNLQLWDTAGQERFKSLTKTYYRGADTVIIVFDISDENSFSEIKYWMNQAISEIRDEVPLFLVANKFDEYEDADSVLLKLVTNYAIEENLNFFLVSAKLNYGIQELLQEVGETVYKLKNNISIEGRRSNIKNDKFVKEFNSFKKNYEKKLKSVEERNVYLERKHEELKNEIEKHRVKIDFNSEILLKQHEKITDLRENIEPKNFKPNKEILENDFLNYYYSSIYGKLYTVIIECEGICSGKFMLNSKDLKTNILSSFMSLIPIVGKYIGTAYEGFSAISKCNQINEYAIKIKATLGKNIDEREYVIKKTAEQLTLHNKETIFKVESNEEIKIWKKKSIIDKVKDFFVVDASKQISINDYQVLGCIDSIKLLHAVISGDIPSHLSKADEIISNLIDSLKKYKFKGNNEIVLVEEEKTVQENNLCESEKNEQNEQLIPKAKHNKKSCCFCFKKGGKN